QNDEYLRHPPRLKSEVCSCSIFFLDCRRRPQGNANLKSSSGRLCRFSPNRPSVRSNDTSAEGKAESYPRDSRFLLSTHKGLKKLLGIARRKTRPIVFHEAIHRGTDSLCPNQYLGIWRRVFQGVIQEIDQHALKQRGVNLKQGQIAGKLSSHFTLKEYRT